MFYNFSVVVYSMACVIQGWRDVTKSHTLIGAVTVRRHSG